MKEKRKLYFPILLKVILLGIIVSFAASSISVVVSYNNMVKKAKNDLDIAATEALEYANGYYSGTTDDIVQKLSSFEYIRNYVLERYSTVDEAKNAELGDYSTFSEYEEVFMNTFPFFYPIGMPGSLEYLTNFRPSYIEINEVLQSTSFYSEQYAFYAVPDPEDNSRLVYLCDSRHSNYRQKNKFYNCPGSHYTLKDSDKVFSIGHEYIKGFKLNGKTTRFIEIKNKDAESGNYVLIGYLFVNYDTSKVYADIAPIMRNEIIILLISVLAVIILYAILSYFTFVRSINKLNRAAVDISNQLKSEKPLKPHQITVKSHDEMKSLSDSFVTMENQLINYVEIIKADAREKEKINAELEIASKIQLEALPSANYDDQNVSVRAYIKPAKEVGGDFYDYFYLDDNRLVFLISDVSGKGVPAALFMMKSKELIKSAMHTNDNLVDVVKEVNRRLSKNNKESLFVTSFIGIVDFKKNEIRYVNAGHEKPYIVSKDKIEKLDGESNFVMGGISEFEYKAETHAFNKGDYIFLFTDGLNESINKEREEFSYSRVEENLEQTKFLSSNKVIDVMNQKLDEFVGKEEQFDDVTMLIIRNRDNELHLSYDKKDYSIIEDIVNQFNNTFVNLPDGVKASVGIVIDELVNNLVSYEKREDLKIEAIFRLKKDELEIEVVSNGEEYDPFENHKEKYLDEFHPDIEEGGFGLSIIKDLAKSTHYKYKDGHSYTTITLEIKK